MAELEERVARVEGLVEGITQGIIPWLDRLEREFEQFRSEIKAEMASLRNELRDNFRWTVGIILGTWVSVMLGIIATFFK